MNVSFFRGTSPCPISDHDPVRIPVRRPILIARWRRAADGVLECRWI